MDVVAHGVAEHVEPLPAACAVDPTLGEGALGVLAVEQVFSPFPVREVIRALGVGDVRLATVVEFGFVAWPAVGA
ncbi:hypothetical protein D3C85_1851280 [compost metagenome]